MSRPIVTRRQFLRACGATTAGFTLSGLGSVSGNAETTDTGRLVVGRKGKVLAEHGFWDYTTPGCGGMERYREDDYRLLLDDMAEAGMNSLVICPKWKTTGYRSHLPFMDQVQDNLVIASDNAPLRYAIEQANKRNIKVWLLACVNYFNPEKFGDFRPIWVREVHLADKSSIAIGVYDSDTPVLAERAALICEELVELFAGIGGLIVEMEKDNFEMPYRIALYNAWAKENGRPSFEQIGHPFYPRRATLSAWRDYTTGRRLEIMKVVERAVRDKGFRGDLAMVCGLGGDNYERCAEINLEMFGDRLADWSTVHYEYTNAVHRYTIKDFGISLPKSLGIRSYYLARGVLTWGMQTLRGIKLEDHWQMDVEDFQLFRPYGAWWFGCGSRNDGYHTSLSTLQSIGYRDGVEARRALLKKVSVL